MANELRETKELSIGDFKITVKELTIEEILGIIKGDQIPNVNDLVSFIAMAEELLPLFVDGINLTELQQLPPSKVKDIYEAFREVNQVFFDLAQTAGLGQLINSVKDAVVSDFLKIAAGSFKQAMEAA
jgi:hypothetical protein